MGYVGRIKKKHILLILQRVSAYLVLFLLFAGCHRVPLTCRSEFLYPTYLASEQVDILDPQRNCFYGQQLLVHWDLPPHCPKTAYIELHIRFGNREFVTIPISIKSYKGWWTYQLINQDYVCKGGILSFKAELKDGDCLLSSWTHFLWADLIEISV